VSYVARVMADVSTPSGDACASIQVAGVTSVARIAIPASWLGKRVRFHLSGLSGTVERAGIRFGTSIAVDVSLSVNTTINGSGVPTEDGKEPHLVIEATQYIDERIDPSWTHLAYIATHAAGKIVMQLKTGDGT
jgi:hypothetical protein